MMGDLGIGNREAEQRCKAAGTQSELVAFVAESNRIEGIVRQPTCAEIAAHVEFLETDLCHSSAAGIGALERLVAVLQPGALIRSRGGMNVRVGYHFPPPGGPDILFQLERLFEQLRVQGAGPDRAYSVHHEYETLHPFMDGNGRSGRALWLWMMGGKAPLGFLHTWYYQSLAAGDQ